MRLKWALVNFTPETLSHIGSSVPMLHSSLWLVCREVQMSKLWLVLIEWLRTMVSKLASSHGFKPWFWMQFPCWCWPVFLNAGILVSKLWSECSATPDLFHVCAGKRKGFAYAFWGDFFFLSGSQLLIPNSWFPGPASRRQIVDQKLYRAWVGNITLFLQI